MPPHGSCFGSFIVLAIKYLKVSFYAYFVASAPLLEPARVTVGKCQEVGGAATAATAAGPQPVRLLCSRIQFANNLTIIAFGVCARSQVVASCAHQPF